MIEEKCLIEGNEHLVLKGGLLEHLDYEAVPKHIYSHLKKWYGSDFELVRYMKKDPVDQKEVFLEIYPGFFFKKNEGFNYGFFLNIREKFRE